MVAISVGYAKTHLAQLVERAAGGETFVITKRGKPVARLMPLERPNVDTSMRLGLLGGKFTVPEDFDRMFEDEIADMFGMSDKKAP